MKNKKIKINKNGFSLIELVISMAMIVILAGAFLNTVSFSDTNRDLVLAVNELKANFRFVQTSALSVPNPADEHICGYGVYIESTNVYKVFSISVDSDDFNEDVNICEAEKKYHYYDDANNDISVLSETTLSESLSFDDVGKSVFFDVPYAEVFNSSGDSLDEAAEISITIMNKNNNSKSLVINGLGKIDEN